MKKLKAYIKNSPFWIRLSYSLPYQRIRMPENYERLMREYHFYKKLFGAGRLALIFDVGGNVGHKADLFRRLAQKVVVFEPVEDCLHILRSRFSGMKNVTIHPIALGSSRDVMSFYKVTDNLAYGSLSEKHIKTTATERSVVKETNVQKQTIEVHKAEEFVVQYGIPDYMKIDVEGFEIEVLKGLTSLVPLISFETNLPEFKEEAIAGIEYLDALSAGNYKYNFAEDTSFIQPDFISAADAILFLQDTSLLYLEIYAKAQL